MLDKCHDRDMQMNGFEFIKKVRQARSFFMTAFEINDVEFSRISPSTRIVIQKPISLKRLNSLILNHTIDGRKTSTVK
ncbi:MAG: hypothetical protein WAM14_05725 [Candidatus Nitrosopolaris sp.]